MPVGIGALVGALVANRLTLLLSRRAMIIWGIFVNGLALALMPLFGNVSAAFSVTVAIVYVAALAFMSGFTNVIVIVCAQTHLHELSQPGERGRLFGSLTSFMNLVGLPFILIVGFVADYVPVLTVVFVLGALLILGALSNYFVHTRYGSGKAVTP